METIVILIVGVLFLGAIILTLGLCKAAAKDDRLRDDAYLREFFQMPPKDIPATPARPFMLDDVSRPKGN